MTKLSYIAIAFIVIASVLCILRLSHVDTVTQSPRVKMDNNNSTNNIIYNNNNSSSNSEVIQEESIMKGTNFTRNDQDTVVMNNTSASRIRQRRVIFIPFPHNTLGSGADMECKWETITLPPYDNNITTYDSTQLAAFAEGVCIPPLLNASIHVFSSNEVRTCLRSKRVIISGDSYMKQLFIGIADILLGKKVHGDMEIMGAENRSHVVATTNYWLARRYESTNFSFPKVEYTCEESCYGRYLAPFSKHCSKCINALTAMDGNNNNTIAVVGAGVHPKANIDEIKKFLTLAKKTIFVPMPHLGDNKSRNYYNAVLPHVAPRQPEHPFLDVYQLTSSCTMANCSYDGGHRSRYVNRWKAQLLLNTLCKII